MINLSGISSESIAGMVMRLPLKLIPQNSILPILQGKLKGKKWIVGSSTHGCWFGTFGYEKQILFSKMIKRDSVVFDIGANAGFHTLLFSGLVGDKGRVFAFEPSARNIRYLKQHLELNGCGNVKVIEAAVSDKNGFAFLKEGIGGLYDHLAKEGDYKVKTFSLDDLVLKDAVPPDYIKINAEGSEMLILSGAQNILTEYSPTIFLSVHNDDLRNQCRTFLETLNYNLRLLFGNKDTSNKNELLAFKKD